ncbi:MAG: class I SAM-dependent methyltransferase [Acidobacteria bacterium]|nr:class I SAM-dependent methyltransferase [Acidobacteriota bacterium]
MTETERENWDRRYAKGDYQPRTEPAPFLEEWLNRLPTGRALDVACGTGRNALRLAEVGYATEAVDISEVAIERARSEADRRGLTIEWRRADLDKIELPEARYDLITVIRYVNRDLWPRLVAALSPNGAVLIEHHLQTEAVVDGPQSPEFRLRPQELLAAFRDLRIVYYSETLEPADRPNATFALARMVAYQGHRSW